MTVPEIPSVDDALHDVVERLTRERGAADLDWLARQARKESRDARVTDETVAAVVDVSTLLVWRPDGTVDHLLHVLDGGILTQRVRAPLAGRGDLWCTVALQPLLNVARAAVVPDTVSFVVEGLPEALHRELSHRAHRYGMSFDQYVVAVLGHLAWRTPFAEDMEPRDDWAPDRAPATVTPLYSCDEREADPERTTTT